MPFTSFNLSRFNSTFKRAMAALGYATDSAIRARVLQEAQSNAVWARFAPSVAGYPSLPRVAGNIQIDESAALTALAGGVSDVLSYTAPDFKAGHTLPPLCMFFPEMLETTYLGSSTWTVTNSGGVGGELASSWGYTINISRGDGSSSYDSELANPNGQKGCRVKFLNDNAGTYKIAGYTRSFLSWEDTSSAESIFVDNSGSGSSASYMIGGSVVQVGSADVMTPSGLIGITATAGVDYTGVFMKDADGTIIRQYNRAMLKPQWCYSNASAASGTSVPEAAALFASEETKEITSIINALTAGNTLDVIRNGQEYQPAWRGNNTLVAWSANRNITVVGEYVKNGGNAYKCITTGTTASSGGPTGTGADITDGTVHWKYMMATTVTWNLDPDVKTWLDTIDAYANDDTNNQAYIDQILGARIESENALKTAIATASPSTLYIYYSNMDGKEGYWDSSSLHLLSKSRRNGTQYGPYLAKSKSYSALPSPEFYRGYASTWTSGSRTSGQAGSMPELVLNAAAACIANSQPLMYPFVSGGWASSFSPPNYISYDDQWMGFMKFLYTAGAIGCDYGYYNSWTSAGSTIADNTGSRAVRHAVIVGHVHATFSHLENYLRSGSLLSGDYDARSLGRSSHWDNKDVYDRTTGLTYPSYEFVHDDAAQGNTKVIARKLDASNDWLICAWKCLDTGVDTTVHSTIAGHALTLNARRGGTLYHMNNSGTLTMLDPLSMDPSRSIATILAGL